MNAVNSRSALRAAMVILSAALPADPWAPADTITHLQFEASIPLPGVKGRIDHLAVDAAGKRLFVAALGNDTVEVIDLAARRPIASLKGVREPQGLAFVPGAARLFAASGADGALSIFDTRQLSLIRAVRLDADDADNVRYDAAHDAIFVGYGAGAIGQFDLNGNLVSRIRLNAHPESFQLERSGSRIFVNVPGARTVDVLDRKAGALLQHWGLGGRLSNYPMALDEDGHRLMVVCRMPARLVVLNTDTGKEVASVPTVGDSDDVFFDSRRRQLYVIGGEGAIAVVARQDADHYVERERIRTVEGARTGWFSPELDRLFVAVRRHGSQPAEIRIFVPQ